VLWILCLKTKIYNYVKYFIDKGKKSNNAKVLHDTFNAISLLETSAYSICVRTSQNNVQLLIVLFGRNSSILSDDTKPLSCWLYLCLECAVMSTVMFSLKWRMYHFTVGVGRHAEVVHVGNCSWFSLMYMLAFDYIWQRMTTLTAGTEF
jgi:hypothetical protein